MTDNHEIVLYDIVREHIAPCGLNCKKCIAHTDGEIKRHSAALADALGPNFGSYARRFAAANPVFEGYEAFRSLLDHFANGSCASCRSGECPFFPCRVRECVQERGVDFCFQCDLFPCDRSGMSGRLLDKWRDNNESMKELGAVEYYLKVRDLPRYP